jgi:hypothetical protein
MDLDAHVLVHEGADGEVCDDPGCERVRPWLAALGTRPSGRVPKDDLLQSFR